MLKFRRVMSTVSERTLTDLQKGLEQLFGRAAEEVSPSRRIFVNRTLRLDEIELIGFDMDYTLAIYRQEAIERLSIQGTLRKMIEGRGYPREILEFEYDPACAIRGILIDRHCGNVLKMDRYGYVGRVYHGMRRLLKEERDELYRNQRIRLSADRYAWIDTLFALPEAVMYLRLVEYF